MSGDKKQKTSKAEEIFYRLSLNSEFKKEVNNLKRFITSNTDDSDKLLEYQLKRHFLIKKYTIPFPKLSDVFDKHVLGKEIKYKDVDYLPTSDFPITVQTPSDKELQESKRAFIKLWVYDSVSRDEILDYVKKNWRSIQIFLKIQGVKRVARIRKIKEKKRNVLILKYNKLSTKKLLEIARVDKEKKQYREILIRRLVEKKGYSLTPEIVKGVVFRSKGNV